MPHSGMPTSAKSNKFRNFANKYDHHRGEDRREIECPETLITYENNIDINDYDDDDMNPATQQKFNNFFNSVDEGGHTGTADSNILLQ